MSRQGNDRLWESRADREYDRFTAHPFRRAFAYLVALALVGLVIAAVVAGAGWVGSWGEEAGRVTGVENTRAQTTAILAAENNMIAAATIACGVETAEKRDGDPTLTEDPLVAYRANYARIKADYDRRMSNLFEAYATAKNPLPGTINALPKVAPTLKERMGAVC